MQNSYERKGKESHFTVAAEHEPKLVRAIQSKSNEMPPSWGRKSGHVVVVNGRKIDHFSTEKRYNQKKIGQTKNHFEKHGIFLAGDGASRGRYNFHFWNKDKSDKSDPIEKAHKIAATAPHPVKIGIRHGHVTGSIELGTAQARAGRAEFYKKNK